MERFDAMRSAGSSERIPSTLTLSKECLLNLDRTLNEVRKRAHRRGSDPNARDAELIALRSAAVEIAAQAYVDRLLKRRRQCDPCIATGQGVRGDDRAAAEVLGRAKAQARGEPVVCMLSTTLLADLDDVGEEFLRENHLDGDLVRRHGVTAETVRSLIVESAVTAWLILRGHSSALSSKPQRPRGWLSSVKHLAAERRWRRRA